MTRLAFVALLAALTVPAWGETAPAESMNHALYVMLGRFVPTDNEFEGHLAVGLQYSWHGAARYAGASYARASAPGLVGATAVELNHETFALMVGARSWRGKWYIGAGVGVAHVKHEVPSGQGLGAVSDDHLAWEVVAGMPLGGKGLAEVRYLDGGDHCSRGLVGLIGMTY